MDTTPPMYIQYIYTQIDHKESGYLHGKDDTGFRDGK